MKEIKVMNLEDYVETLQNIIEETPRSANFEVIIAMDEQDSLFDTIHFKPTVGFWEEDAQLFDPNSNESVMNAICVN